MAITLSEVHKPAQANVMQLQDMGLRTLFSRMTMMRRFWHRLSSEGEHFTRCAPARVRCDH